MFEFIFFSIYLVYTLRGAGAWGGEEGIEAIVTFLPLFAALLDTIIERDSGYFEFRNIFLFPSQTEEFFLCNFISIVVSPYFDSLESASR